MLARLLDLLRRWATIGVRKCREAGWGIIFGIALHLYALATLLGVLVLLTSNTGNILAWGFGGLPALERSFLGAFIYEFTHTSAAYGALSAGIWFSGFAVAVTGVVYRSLSMIRVHGLLLCHSLTALAIGVGLNALLFQFPDPTSWRTYLDLLLANPTIGMQWETKPSRFFIFCFPAILAVAGLAVPAIWRLEGYLLACSSALLSAPAPWFAVNYLSHHFLCYSNPNRFGWILGILSVFLYFVPPLITGFLLDRARKRGRTNR